MRARTAIAVSLTITTATIAIAGLTLSLDARHSTPTYKTISYRPQPHANLERNIPAVIDAPPIEPTDGPVVQLALLLDTSNSMDGLITQAKTRLWSIVNELARVSHNGDRPQLQVALYEYGNDSISPKAGHIRRRVAFTTDLDILSEQLFSLTTNGGQEYCGMVIDEAVAHLGWITTDEQIAVPVEDPANELDQDLIEQVEEAFDDALSDQPHADPLVPRKPGQKVVRMIVIAGNEPFTQGTTPYQEAISDAGARDIIVNTIFCGSHDEGESTGWLDGATLGNGRYVSINHNRSVVEIPTPFDDEIVMLNTQLNETYIPYGAYGDTAKRRQVSQDQSNASTSIAAMTLRAASKATSLYTNTSWDLVDAYEQDMTVLSALPSDELPEDLRSLSKEELEAHIKATLAKRNEVRKSITEISAKRSGFIARNTPEDPKDAALHEAIISMIRDQVEASGFTVEDDPAQDE